MLKHYNENDVALEKKLDYIELLQGVDADDLPSYEGACHYEVTRSCEEFNFLHECAIIEYHGVLFASWYNCREVELKGYTPICGKRSYDGGKTWTESEIIAEDKTGEILYCPPVYAISDDKLYMFVNEMVSADHIHGLDLFVLNEKTDRFEKLWFKPIPFKLNTNAYELSNGKLMLPGRIGEIDGFPITPAVMISDSGKADADWRIVKIQENGFLPDGSKFVHPELSAVISGETVYIFSRNDERSVPIMYISRDCGETWSAPIAHNIPFAHSKIYSGTLSNGKNYVIGNIFPERERLAIFFTEPGEMVFKSGYMIQNGFSKDLDYGYFWHYPCAYESDGKLYIIYTANIDINHRGAALTVLPIDNPR